MSASHDLRRSVACLALEVPGSVWDDVNAKADAVLAEHNALLVLADELIRYSELRSKVRLREDQSEYVEAERLIGIYDALLTGSEHS